MAGNIAVDAVLGALPFAGDIFDAAWKANLRNLSLLERYGAVPSQAARADRLFVIAVSVLLLLLSAALVAGGALLTVGMLARLL